MRSPCLVPFCRRTTKGEGFQWICSNHWPNVPRPLKATLSKCRRDYRRQFGDNPYWSYPAGSEKRLAAVDADRAFRKAWDECKAAALDAAVGLS